MDVKKMNRLAIFGFRSVLVPIMIMSGWNIFVRFLDNRNSYSDFPLVLDIVCTALLISAIVTGIMALINLKKHPELQGKFYAIFSILGGVLLLFMRYVFQYLI